MKKRMISLAAGMCVAALLLTGCSSEISNEYVTVSKYKGLEVEKAEAEKITDESVDNWIQGMLEGHASTKEVTGRAAQEGDTVVIDYVGKMDGEAFEGGTAKGADLKLGSNTYIDGFEAGVIGHQIGETFDLNLTFPEDYKPSPEKSGKEAVFTVTLNAIREEEIPELNDEFVKSVSEKSKTVKEYKKEVKAQLEESAKQTAEESMNEAIMNALMDNSEVTKYPKDELKKMQDRIRGQYEEMASYYGMEFTEFLNSYMGMDEDTFNTQLVKAAKMQVKNQLVIDLIVEKAKIDVSDKVLEKRYEQYVKDYGFESVKQMKEAMSENGSGDELKRMAVTEEVQKWLVANCKQVEKKADDSSAVK